MKTIEQESLRRINGGWRRAVDIIGGSVVDGALFGYGLCNTGCAILGAEVGLAYGLWNYGKK